MFIPVVHQKDIFVATKLEFHFNEPVVKLTELVLVSYLINLMVCMYASFSIITVEIVIVREMLKPYRKQIMLIFYHFYVDNATVSKLNKIFPVK